MKPLAVAELRARTSQMEALADDIENDRLVEAAKSISNQIKYLAGLSAKISKWQDETTPKRDPQDIGLIQQDNDDIAIRVVDLSIVCTEDDALPISNSLAHQEMGIANCGATVRLATQEEAMQASSAIAESQ